MRRCSLQGPPNFMSSDASSEPEKYLQKVEIEDLYGAMVWSFMAWVARGMGNWSCR